MNKDKYISLIIEKLNEVISISDDKILTSWLSENNDNKLIFKDIEQIWLDTKDIKSTIISDKEKSWDIIQTKIANNETKIIPLKKLSYMKIASVLVILFSSVFLINNFLSSDEFISETTEKNELKNIVLPDGSSIDLNENSTIRYSKKFEKRNVAIKGEVFFDIVEDKTKPFSIKTFDTETVVLGTSFNINAYKKQAIKISLYTGKIKFKANNQETVLKPGDKISYDNKKMILFETEKNNINEIAWKTKTLIFDNTKIQMVVSDLETFYHKKISIKNLENITCVFTGTFKNKEFNEAIESIAYTYDAQYTVENDIIYFSKLDCQ